MGGLSTLSILNECGGLRFNGAISHRNNGGFVSARMIDYAVVCPDNASGLRVFWAGDDRAYRLIVHENNRRVREYFECVLHTSPMTILWNDFEHRYRNLSDDDRRLKPQLLSSIGVLVSKTHSGPVDFFLERLEWVMQS